MKISRFSVIRSWFLSGSAIRQNLGRFTISVCTELLNFVSESLLDVAGERLSAGVGSNANGCQWPMEFEGADPVLTARPSAGAAISLLKGMNRRVSAVSGRNSCALLSAVAFRQQRSRLTLEAVSHN
ncbi:hypothetical protein [Rhizobium sp. P44RR-XXIV]|uniref:hypothetical protein n=1 Tax=Rhizobium sp. P44RR-XXIV TaxID=1921145 RepID=UPI0010AA7B92|nr:hypothetical protein [Rhizobium sp. P44RR-XXIV]TIX86592.1 hypothetical protein BSK43_026755 [Rhizobium sp. P44RR-XXIV]